MSRYDFHGVLIEVDVDDPPLAEAIDGRLRHFRSDARAQPDLRYEYRTGVVVEPPAGRSRPVYEPPSGEVVYSDVDDVLFIRHGDVRVRCEPAAGSVLVSSPQDRDLWLLSRPLFTLPLVESLKRRGL